MAIRSIRLFGDPVLRTAAEPVTDFDKQLRNLVKDLTETLKDAQGADNQDDEKHRPVEIAGVGGLEHETG